MATKFFTNSEENTLLKKLEGIFRHMNVYHFDAVIGYFRASGYFRIHPYLRNTQKIRILVGINVDQLTFKAYSGGIEFHSSPAEAREETLRKLKDDIQGAAYDKQVEEGMIQFLHDLADGKIEMRAHPSKNLHAKIYIFRDEVEHEHAGYGAVITGSSNLTEAGLERNFEFNVELRDHDDVVFATKTFDKLWEESTELRPEFIEQLKKQTYLNDELTPFEIYIKFLIEYFDRSVDYDPDDTSDLPTKYMRLKYQVDAVNQGYDKLRRFHGFFLADVVGLGKTIVATLIARKFAYHNGIRTRVLIIYPPALKKAWHDTINDFNLGFPIDYISNGSLHKIAHPENYDLIIVDEAHKFRSDTSEMFNQLQKLCKMPRRNPGPDGDTKKHVILVSATPLNNKPEDIRNLIFLFQDARDSTLEVSNLTHWFSSRIDRYRKLKDHPDRKLALNGIKKLYEEIRLQILEQITVRRTRTDILENEEYKIDLDKQGLRFPNIKPPEAILYKLNPELNKLFDDTIVLLQNPHRGLKYYRYQAIKFLVEPYKSKYENADSISDRLKKIMKTLLVKRLDSSFYSFIESLKRYRNANRAMLQMIENDRIHVAPALNVSEHILNDSEDELIAKMEKLKANDPSVETYRADDFDEGYLRGLLQDQELIDALCERWEHWQTHNKDPKVVTFIDQLKNSLLHDTGIGHEKLVVFSEYSDTTNFLKRELENAGFKKILTVDSSNHKELVETIARNFDARQPIEKRQDKYDIIITTEVLAEGVNLHRAHKILNYDIPWNSTRLMQRIGRVNRVGTEAETIFIYNFYPTEQTENQIELHKKALLKLQAFHSALGEDSQIYSEEEEYGTYGMFETVGKDEEKDERLSILLDLRKFKNDHPEWFSKIKRLPMRCRTGRVSDKLGGQSVVFLKNNRRDGFYLHLKDVEEIGFLQAANILKATADEKGLKLPGFHHQHVQDAVQHFVLAQHVQRQEEKRASKLGPNDQRALGMLEKMYRWPDIADDERQLFAEGKEAVVLGKFQHLVRDVNKLTKAHRKTPFAPAVLIAKLKEILLRYPISKNGTDEEQPERPLKSDEPVIVISQSFSTTAT